jgi:hypothetical protein
MHLVTNYSYQISCDLVDRIDASCCQNLSSEIHGRIFSANLQFEMIDYQKRNMLEGLSVHDNIHDQKTHPQKR